MSLDNHVESEPILITSSPEFKLLNTSKLKLSAFKIPADEYYEYTLVNVYKVIFGFYCDKKSIANIKNISLNISGSVSCTTLPSKIGYISFWDNFKLSPTQSVSIIVGVINNNVPAPKIYAIHRSKSVTNGCVSYLIHINSQEQQPLLLENTCYNNILQKDNRVYCLRYSF